MRKFGGVEHQPVAHFLVEQREIGEQEVFVIVNEALLDGSVESLTVGVHLGCFWVGFPVHHIMV